MNIKYTPHTLKKLEELFAQAQYKLRYEKGSFSSGYCIIEHQKMAVINKFLDTEARINVLMDLLPQLSIDEGQLPAGQLRYLRSLQSAATSTQSTINSDL